MRISFPADEESLPACAGWASAPGFELLIASSRLYVNADGVGVSISRRKARGEDRLKVLGPVPIGVGKVLVGNAA